MTNSTSAPRARLATGVAVFLVACVGLGAAPVGASDRGASARADDLTPQILNGALADPARWPSHAALRVQSAKGADYVCGGVVIAPRWVLTAAHCAVLDGRPVEAVIGAADLTEVSHGQVYAVVETVRHPGSEDPIRSGHDVALMRLGRRYDGPVARIARGSGEEPAPGGAARVAGHGLRTFGGGAATLRAPDGGLATAGSARLRAAAMRLVDTEACRARYTAAFGESFAIGERQLCAEPASGPGGGASCSGDSSGALVAAGADGRPVVIGLVSWAYRCGEAVAPTVFTRVSAYAGFIDRVTTRGP